MFVRLASTSAQTYAVIIVNSPSRRRGSVIGVVRNLVKLSSTCALHVGLWKSVNPTCIVRVVGMTQELSVLFVAQNEVETNFIFTVTVGLVILKGSVSIGLAIERT